MIPVELLPYTIIGLGAIAIALSVWVAMLERRINKLMIGKDGANLEDTMHELIAHYQNIEKYYQQAQTEMHTLRSKISTSLRGVHTVRFNAFGDSGGNQSFATALLDEHGSGVILSTLFSRERMSVFAKPIKEFHSQFGLSKEEEEALKGARASLGAPQILEPAPETDS